MKNVIPMRGWWAGVLLVAAFVQPAVAELAPGVQSAERMASPLRAASAPRRGGVLPVVSLNLDADLARNLRGREAVTLTDFVLAPEGPGAIQRIVEVDLQRINVIGEQTRFVDGSRGARLPLPDVELFSGSVAGHPGSRVFLSISPRTGEAFGYVRLGARTQIISSGPPTEARQLLIYDSQALPEGTIPWRDFVCEAPTVARQRHPGADAWMGGAAGALPCRSILLAIETDHEFLAHLFGGDVVQAGNYIATLIGAMSEIYTAQLNVQFELGFVRLWPVVDQTYPWTAQDAWGQLFEFGDLWNEEMGSVERDLAHFLSGRALGGGVAWLGVVCDLASAYAVSSGLNGFFPYPLQNNSPQNWDPFVVAHELGHNLGAIHTHDYCDEPLDNCASGDAMGACQFESECGQGTIMSYCHGCGGGVSNIVLEFHPVVAADILFYLEGLSPDDCPLECPDDNGGGPDPHDGFCIPSAPSPCEGETDGASEWDEWQRLLRDFGSGAKDAHSQSNFGRRVAVDGDLAIVGADRETVSIGGEEFVQVGAAYIFEFKNSSWVQVAKLVPPADCAESFMGFGGAVDITSSPNLDIAVVGAPGAGFGRGAAFVYRRIGGSGNWVLDPLIPTEPDDKDPKNGDDGIEPPCGFGLWAEGSEEFESFGDTVAIAPFRLALDECGGGDLIVVGAPFAGIATGAAYVFRYHSGGGDQTGWKREGRLADATSVFAQLGSSVSVGRSVMTGGEVVVAGAWLDGFFVGAAYVYRRRIIDGDPFWYVEQVLHPNAPFPADLFGLSVSFESTFDTGDMVAVGAPQRLGTIIHPGDPMEVEVVPDAGAAFVFRRLSSGEWVQDAELFAPVPQNFSAMGGSVGISGNALVSGAFGTIVEGVPNRGAAYVYRHTGSAWLFDTELFPFSQYAGDMDEFGIGVDISRNAIIVGSRREHENNVHRAGAAYMYGRCPGLCPGSGACFAANPTPGCAAAGCCDVVCEELPFCCDGAWTATCAQLALSVCGGCGSPAAGPCLTANATPGCDHSSCCASVCQVDEFCCAGHWDEDCAIIAQGLNICAASACPGEGSCLEANGSPGCETPDCCSSVCEFVPSCCLGEWTETCAIVATFFASCTAPEACPSEGNCLTPHASPGCNSTACCNAVCQVEPFCCGVAWDSLCVDVAMSEEACIPEDPCAAGAEDCFSVHESPGCDDQRCCALVCAEMPLCCEVAWTVSCVVAAADLCGVDCPGDITGDNNTNVFDLLALLAAWGECPGCPEDLNGDGFVNVFDLLILLAEWGPCE